MVIARRRFNQLLGASSCLPVLHACQLTPARPLIIGVQMWPGYEPMLFAKTMGWIKDKHATFKSTESATDNIAQLGEKKLDAAGLTLDEVMRARERGIDLTIIMVCDISAGADVLLARPNINTLRDLKGKRIGAEDGALGALMVYQVLKAAQLKLDDVTVVSVTSNHHEEAWRSGTVDAIATYEPSAGAISRMGAKSLFDSRSIADLILDVLAVRTEVLNAGYAESLRAVVAGHLRALSYIDTNPIDAAYRLATRFNLPAEQALSIFSGMVLPDLDNNRRLLKGEGAAIKKSISMVSEALLASGVLRQPPNVDKLYTPDYLPRNAT